MKATKKILIFFPGIADQDNTPEKVKNTNFDLTPYHEVFYFPSELYRDPWGGSNLLNKLPCIGSFLDKHGDYIKFSLDKKKRKLIRKKIKEFIERIKAENTVFTTEITCIAHSMGCWEILGTDTKIDKLVLLGSPTGLFVPWLRETVCSELWEAGTNLKSKTVIELYSPEDPICCYPVDPLFISKVSSDYLRHRVKSNHSLIQYLNELQELKKS